MFSFRRTLVAAVALLGLCVCSSAVSASHDGAPSSTKYVLSDIANTFYESYNPSGSMHPNILIHYDDGTASDSHSQGAQVLPTVTPTSADPISVSFYSHLSVTSGSVGRTGVIPDPIGYYYYIKQHDGEHPEWVVDSTEQNGGHPGVVPAGTIPAGQESDADHPFLCVSTDAAGMNSDGSFPLRQPATLVNDATVWPVGNTYYISCNVWDLQGTSDQLTIVLPIANYTQ